MSDPIVFRGLTKEQADATAKFHNDNGADAVVLPDGTGHFSVRVIYPDNPPVIPGGVRTDGVFNAKYDAYFIALVPNGFFSSDPDDLGVPRSRRSNNPGALNISPWQKKRPGYVGVTKDDGHGNVTTIYSSPEYGVAAWYFLLSDRYGFASSSDRSFAIDRLARKYAGANASQATVDNYVNGWSRLAERPITSTSLIHLDSDAEMLNLARAMYKLEAGAHLTLGNDQILFGIGKERSKTLPDPPARP
jgi:D-alanyl-D-alanine carboxypeptidase